DNGLDAFPTRPLARTLLNFATKRRRFRTRQRIVSARLLNLRAQLRTRLGELSERLKEVSPESSKRGLRIATHGLLKRTETRLVQEAMAIASIPAAEAQAVLDNIEANLGQRRSQRDLQRQIEKTNRALGRVIKRCLALKCLPDDPWLHNLQDLLAVL